MKLLLSRLPILFCLISVSALGQTYAYRHIYTVDEDGVKRAPQNGIVYITFTDNMGKFYPSDENGITKTYGQKTMGFGYHRVILYKGEENGRYRYVVDTSAKTEQYSGGYDPYGTEHLKNAFRNRSHEVGADLAKQLGGIFVFSSDFKKLNVSPYLLRRDGGLYDNVVDVYERYSPGSSTNQFYE